VGDAPLRGERGRRSPAVRRVRTIDVLVDTPRFVEDLRLEEGVEELAVQVLVAHPAVIGLDPGVPPQTVWRSGVSQNARPRIASVSVPHRWDVDAQNAGDHAVGQARQFGDLLSSVITGRLATETLTQTVEAQEAS